MPKRYNTKKQRADELLKTLLQGPSLWDSKLSPEMIEKLEHGVGLWLRSFVIPETIRLIPELKEKIPEIDDLLGYN